jgi:hypothetical protein
LLTAAGDGERIEAVFALSSRPARDPSPVILPSVPVALDKVGTGYSCGSSGQIAPKSASGLNLFRKASDKGATAVACWLKILAHHVIGFAETF